MKTVSLPKEWLPTQRQPLTAQTLCRFDEKTRAHLEALAEMHNVSLAEIVRILVHQSLASLGNNRAA